MVYAKETLALVLSLAVVTSLAGCNLIDQKSGTTGVHAMTQGQLDRLIRRYGSDVHGSADFLKFVYDNVPMLCISDVGHDRMRIIAPVRETSQLAPGQMAVLMEANFDRALDARYAIRDGIVFAAFIHPLSPLTDAEVVAALREVASLTKTFGTAYSSGDLVFGGGGELGPGQPPGRPN